jgi:ADP-heptose:LPS heptosyltransferase
LNNKGFSRIEDVIDDIKNHDSIVLYRDIGGIGDAVMITGAITGLRRDLGKGFKLIVATIPYVAPIFYNNPDIDWIVDSSKFDKIHGDGAVNYGSGKNILRSIFEKHGALFIGLSHPCPSSQYEAINEPLPKRKTQIIKSRQELFSEACDVKFKQGDCHLYLTEQEIDSFHKPFDNYIVFHTKSNSRSRNLPNNHIDYLTSLLSKKFNVVLLSHEYKYRLDKYKNVVKMDHSPLREIMTTIALSDMVVGVDSMGLHVGGGFAVPLYGIFGTIDPDMRLKAYPNASWFTGYSRCRRKPCWYHPCIFGFCMKSISMKEVSEDIIWHYDMTYKMEGLMV